MKSSIKFLAMLFILGLVALVAACEVNPVDPTESTPTPAITAHNALGNWQDGGDGVYTILTNTAAELEFTYDKGTYPYAYMASPTITEDLSIFKKLVITVEGTGSMLIKLETMDETPDKEVGLNVTGIKGTYEWNLINDAEFLSKVGRIVIIAAPGKEDSIGAISVSALTFDVSVADNYIINDGFTNIPSNVNEYNGTDEIFNFNAKWANFAEEVYEVTEVDGKVEVSFTKTAGQEWAALESLVQGNFTNFNYVVAKISGTEGQPIIVKAANNVETRVFLTSEVQDVVVDLSNMSLADKNAITSILIFGNAGRIGSGTFVIHEAFFIDEYTYDAPTIEKNVYDGLAQSFDLTYWYDGGDRVYTITDTVDGVHVAYSKLESSMHYSFMIAHLEGDLSHFSFVEFVITGMAGRSALLKVEGPMGNIEQHVNFDGSEQTFVIDLSGFSADQINALNKVLVFAAPGGIGTGEFTLHQVSFKEQAYSFVDGWFENDLDTYDFTLTQDQTLLVDFDKAAGQEWAFMRFDFEAEDVLGLNTMTLVLKASAGMEILVKPNDSGMLESWIIFTDDQPYTFNVSTETFTHILIFANPNQVSSGQFEILSATLSFVRPDALDPNTPYVFTHGWTDNDGGIYTFNQVGQKNVITFDKEAGQEWAFLRYNFEEDLSNHNTVTITISGDAGLELLLKPNDSWLFERFVTLTTEPQTFVFEMSETPRNFLLFASPIQGTLTGSFTIEMAYVSFELHDYEIDSDWIDNDGGIYTFVKEDGVTTVSYEKEAGQSWAFIKTEFEADLSAYNRLTVVVKGETGKQLIIKPNDFWMYEQTVTFDGLNQTIVFELDTTLTMILIFVDPIHESLTGEFEIISLTMSYVEAEVEDGDLELESDWIDNDGGIYTFVKEDGVTTVSYEKEAGQSWAFIKTEFEADLSAYNRLTVVVKGETGKQLIIKPNDFWMYEQTVTFDGLNQTIVFELDTTLTMILIFVDPIHESLTGEFEIISLTMSYVEAEEPMGEADFTTGWIDNDGNAYVITVLDDKTTITFDRDASSWAFVKYVFEGDYSAFNTFTLTVVGDSGMQILFKANNQNQFEQWVTLTGTSQEIVLTITEEPTMLFIFFDPMGDTLVGQLEITQATLTYVE